MVPKIVRSAVRVFFEYDTPSIVHIRSKKAGVINRFIQLVIIGYVIGYAIVYKKGYQEFDDVQGVVTTKLKGVAWTNSSLPGLQDRIWDVVDYVVPPQENDAFFVTTNLIITENQTMGTCEEDPKVEGAVCTHDPKVCRKGEPLDAGDGYMTGNCINSTRKNHTKVCEVHAWCETEKGGDPLDPAVLLESKNFTVFIKNNVEFRKFGVKRRNIMGYNKSELTTCRFKPNHPPNKFCPIFLLSDIVGLAGEQYDEMAVKGGVIQIVIEWDCNLDNSQDECNPAYTFRRLDTKDDVVSPGYNFRYAHYYKEANDIEYRTLYKAYGIRFIITVQGSAGKFSFVPLMLNLGSGLALLSIATILCDIVVLYILKARSVYREKKYVEVIGDDAYRNVVESFWLPVCLGHVQFLQAQYPEKFQPQYMKVTMRAIFDRKGYADFDDDVQGAVTTDLKGVALTNMSSVLGLQNRIWDVADYVVPPKENNAFFVITNLIITENQTIGTCEEDPEVYGADCTQDPGVCKKGEPLREGDGNINIVECKINFSTCICNRPNPPVLLESKHFTVHIMSDIEFPKYGVKRTNMKGYNENELLTCRFKHKDPIDKDCPIFILDDIVSLAGENYDEMAVKGGVIQIKLDWDCNLDYNEDKCKPTYTFRRLDSKTRKETRGYNFRYAHYYQSADGREYRTLYKAYGITFIILVQGTASKLNLFRLVLSVGSGLGYLTVATIICDVIVYNCLTNEESSYRKSKYKEETVDGIKKSSAYNRMKKAFACICKNRGTKLDHRSEDIWI